MLKIFGRLLIVSGLLLVCAVGSLTAQSSTFNQRDDQYRLLGLKRAREVYEVARADYDRQTELFDRDLITRTDLDRAKSLFADAEVNYQQSLLAVLFEEKYVSVQKAVKYQAEDGTKHVRVTLANLSGGSSEYQALIGIEDDLFQALKPEVIHNVYISILNDQQATISQPYEVKIDELIYGHPRVVDFTLIQDLDEVTVYLIYGSGSQRNMKIFLQKDDSENRVAVQSEQFSQEVELGKKAKFDLTLELFSGIDNTFSLEVVNLPRQIGRFFSDKRSGARLSQLKFTESTNSKRAELEISLPERPTDRVVMNQPIPFYVLVLPRDKAASIKNDRDRIWTPEEIEALGVGYVVLELVPKGIGELVVRAPQLYHSILADETVSMSIDVTNEGSHRLDNIQVKIDLPLNWSKEISPTTIPSLDIGEDARITLSFIPPTDVPVGKYEVRVRTSAESNTQPVTGEDKTVTVEIEQQANLWITSLLVFVLIGLVGGMVSYGIKLSRR